MPYSALGFPGADDLANMFQFNTAFEPEYRATRDLQTSHRLCPNLASFEQLLAQNARYIPVG